MESTTASAAALLTLSKTLNSCSLRRHQFGRYLVGQTLHKRFSCGRIRCISNGGNGGFGARSNEFGSVSCPAKLVWRLPFRAPIASRLACAPRSDAYFASGGGGGAFGGGNGDGGGGGGGESGNGGADGRETKSKAVAAELDEFSPDVIILDVGGMTCGGCAANVKRILESQPLVFSANVNLATETAIVWPVPEAKSTNNWQQQLGETLAKHLTSCGFKSNIRGLGAIEGVSHT